jgi:riboflavin synthase
MFTGIVEDVGRVLYVRNSSVRLSTGLDDIFTGDSVMVDGVCLTVTEVSSRTLTMDISRETLKRTALARLRPQSKVNLEWAMKLSDRIHGHIVYGHVTHVGRVISCRTVSNTKQMKIKVAGDFLNSLVKKGSVAVNGVSLTVNSIESSHFSVAVIPETTKRSNLGMLTSSSVVNLEPDMMLLGGRK